MVHRLTPLAQFTFSGERIVIVLIVLSLLAIIAFVVTSLILRKYVRLIVNVLDDQTLEPEIGTNGHARPNGEVVKFTAADGHPLKGTILKARGGPATGMVIFAHEFGSERSSCVRYCQALINGGYDVFAFDFRGHGESPAEPGYRPRWLPTDRETSDMRGAIDYITRRLESLGRPKDLTLFGVSRGGNAAIMAAVGLPHVKTLITDGVFSSDVTLEYLMRRFATIFGGIRVLTENYPPTFWRFMRWLLLRECARRYRCRFPSTQSALRRLGRKPLLMIHGQRDSYVPITQAQQLYDIAHGPKKLWIVPDARHNESVLVNPNTYGQRVVSFLNEHAIPGQSPQPAMVPTPRRGFSERLKRTPANLSTPVIATEMETIANSAAT